MISARFIKHCLQFIKPARTSRDTLLSKDTFYLILFDTKSGSTGIGECSMIPGLSLDNPALYETVLHDLCTSGLETDLTNFPSIRFGLETALADLKNGGRKILFDNDFTNGRKSIPINGLIWIADRNDMKLQVKQKIKEGFNCIKIKIGTADFKDEFEFLKNIRKEYPATDITLRLDANGAYEGKVALEILKQLSELDIHSIEQPIKAGNWDEMANICEKSPVPIALDEELIRISKFDRKQMLVNSLKPAYLVLKPSLLGGFESCKEWITIANATNTKWWITSALESNIGLNAIAQWTANYEINIPQGLGTGNLYSNNLVSPLEVVGGKLFYRQDGVWGSLFKVSGSKLGGLHLF
jgi:o-succinylbenzoate synthase